MDTLPPAAAVITVLPTLPTASTFSLICLSYCLSSSEDSDIDTRRLFLYDGWNVIAEIETRPPATAAPAAGAASHQLLARYLWGTDLSGTLQGAGGVGGLLMAHITSPSSTNSELSSSNDTTSYYPAYDGNGNLIAWASASGVQQRNDYDPFGKLISRQGKIDNLHYGFSTKYQDQETGLHYYGYRYYDPVTGRWPSRDPIEEDGGYNLYVFLENDGVNEVDYLGLKWTKKKAIDKVSSTQKSWSGKYPFASRLMKYWLDENAKAPKGSILNYTPTVADISEVKKQGINKIEGWMVAHITVEKWTTSGIVKGTRLNRDFLPVFNPKMFRAYGGVRLSYSNVGAGKKYSIGRRSTNLDGKFEITLNDTYSWPKEWATYLSETYDAAKWLEDNCKYKEFKHEMTFQYEF